MKPNPSSSRKSKQLQENMDQDQDLDLGKPLHSISHYMNDKEEMINQIFSVVHGAQLQAMLPPILKEMAVEKLKRLCLQQLTLMSQKTILHILEAGQPEGAGDNNKEEESNGKTLMELLELEMRARAIKALLKRQEAGDEKGKHPSQDDNPITDTVADVTSQLAGRPEERLATDESWPDRKGHSKSMSVKRAMFLQLEREKMEKADSATHHQSTAGAKRVRRDKQQVKKDWIFHRKDKKASDTRHYRHRKSDPVAVKMTQTLADFNSTSEEGRSGRENLALTVPSDSQRHSEPIVSSDEESRRLEDSIGIQEVDIELGSESSSSEEVDRASSTTRIKPVANPVPKKEEFCREREVVCQETEQIDKGTTNPLICAKDKEGHSQSQWKEARANRKGIQVPEQKTIGSSLQSSFHCKSSPHLDDDDDDWHLNSNEILSKPITVIDNNWSDSSWEDSAEKSPHYRPQTLGPDEPVFSGLQTKDFFNHNISGRKKHL